MIAAQGLTKRFGEKLAVDDVSFEIEPGQVVGFLGPNGAGKTTTLRMLLGLVRPTSGESQVLGRPFEELDDPLKRVGVLFESGLHPGRTARAHLRACAELGGLGTGRIDTVLDQVGLAGDADRRVREYSQGMRQRLGIGAALLADPEVLVLDEPANGLDPEGIRWLRELLRGLAGEGRTIIVSSHQLAEVAQTVDRVLVMSEGSLIAEESLPDLVRRAGSQVVVRSPGAEVLAERLARAGVATADVSAEEVRTRDVPASVVGELAASSGLPVWEVRSEEPSLEEVFFDLTSGGNGDGKGSEPDDDEPEEDLEDAEAAVDRSLERLPALEGAHVVAVTAPAAGLGRTTLAFLLADVLAECLGARALALALSPDGERMTLPTPPAERSSLDLGDLLADLHGFDDASRIHPYVSTGASGLHTLSGPREAEALQDLDAGRVRALLDFAARFYEVVVVDVGELPGEALRAVVERADQVLLLGAPGEDLGEPAPVVDAIESLRSERATLVLNRAAPDMRAGGAGPHALVPEDRDLMRALDSGDYRLEQVDARTRVALKRLGLLVAEGLR